MTYLRLIIRSCECFHEFVLGFIETIPICNSIHFQSLIFLHCTLASENNAQSYKALKIAFDVEEISCFKQK